MDILVNNINEINKNTLTNINNILLSNYEIEVLDKYNINYNKCNSLKEILFLIDKILNNTENELSDLEEISISISDRDYYQNTRI